MTSRDLNEPALVDLHWEGHGRTVLVEIKRTNSARDVREALMALSYALQDEDRQADALCVVADSRLSHKRLVEELQRFRAIVRPQLGNRVFIACQSEDGRLEGKLPVDYPGFHRDVLDAIQRERAPGAARVTRQHVKAALVERHLCRLVGLTMAETRRLTGASHPTIAAALDELEQINVVGPERDGPIHLRPLSVGVLTKLADEHAASRKTLAYRDPTGHGRPPSALAKRLATLRGKGGVGNVAIGGVLGATRLFKALDITAPPRLDLCVFDGDLSFLQDLDAGLIEVGKRTDRGQALVIHLQRDCRPPEIAEREPDYAARLDCLADLREIGLHREADEFAYGLYEAMKEAA